MAAVQGKTTPQGASARALNEPRKPSKGIIYNMRGGGNSLKERFPRLFISANTNVWYWECFFSGLMAIPARLFGHVKRESLLVMYLLLGLQIFSWHDYFIVLEEFHCYDSVYSAGNGTCNGDWGIALIAAGHRGLGGVLLEAWFFMNFALTASFFGIQLVFAYKTRKGVLETLVQQNASTIKKLIVGRGGHITDDEFDKFYGKQKGVGYSVYEFTVMRVWASPFSYLLDTPTWWISGKAGHAIRRIGINFVGLIALLLLWFVDDLVGDCPSSSSFSHLDSDATCRTSSIVQAIFICITCLCALVSIALMELSEEYFKAALQRDLITISEKYKETKYPL